MGALLSCPAATERLFTQPPSTKTSPAWPETGTTWAKATFSAEGRLRIRRALPRRKGGMPDASCETIPLRALLSTPACFVQSAGKLRWPAPPSASVREKSPFTSRLTRSAMIPASNCGQANHAVPAEASQASSRRTAPASAMCAVTCTRSQPSAFGPQEDSAVEPVTGGFRRRLPPPSGGRTRRRP